MAVKVCGNVVGRVPQPLLDLLHGNSVCKQKTCTAVAEVMKTQRLKPVLILIFNQTIDTIQSLPVMLLMVSLDNEKIVSHSLSTTF